MKRAIGYTRVSTEDQSREGCSLEMQETKIKAYCELNDMVLVGIVKDAGISAKNIDGRPGFKAALGRVMRGEADALVVYKLDRAFRNTRDALETSEKLNKAGRQLHSITEKLDTSSAIGEFFFTLMASLAQMERRLIGERTRAAMEEKRRRGERISGIAPYGYRFEADGLVMDTGEQAVISSILQLHRDGHSTRGIVRLLEEQGYRNRKARPFGRTEVRTILRKAA